MATPIFIAATPQAQREALIGLNTEYMAWVAEGVERHLGMAQQALNGMTLADYVSGTLDKVCGKGPPEGIFYIVEVDGQPAGMGGLRRLQDGVAEIKRFYIRPEHRGLKLGKALLRRLLMDAHQFGYHTTRLDSAPFMHAAHQLYATAGFKDCTAYEGSEVPAALRPHWRFMQRHEALIRQAGPADAGAVQACIAAAFSPYIERIGRPPAPMLLDIPKEIVAQRVWVAEAGGTLAGTIVQYPTEQGFYIDTVAVAPEVRGTGIGRALLQFAEQEATRRDCEQVYLCTNSRMVENQALYTRIGYTEYERKSVGPYDRVFYRKPLV